MDKKTIAIGIGVVVLIIWLAKRMQPSETQTITQLVPVGSVPSTANQDSNQVYDANKTTAFLGVLELGKAELAAKVQQMNIGTQIPLEQIRADVTLASFDRDLGLGNLSSKTALELSRMQTESQQAQTFAAIQASERALQLQNEAQAQRMREATQAINSASITYRNQSLERQGTILNALTTLYTGQAPYTYQSAFGGTRPPGILQQLFPQGIGSAISGLFGLF